MTIDKGPVKHRAIRTRILQLLGSILPGKYLTAAVLPALRDSIACIGASAAVMSCVGLVDDVFADWLPDVGEMHALIEATESRWRSLHAALRLPPHQGVSWSLVRRAHIGAWACHALEFWRCNENGRTEIITLYRPSDVGCFSSEEARLGSELLQPLTAPRIEHADIGLEFADTEDVAILVADSHGKLLHASEGGRALLLLSTGHPMSRVTLARAEQITTEMLQPAGSVGSSRRGSGVKGELMEPRVTPWGRFVVRRFDNLDPGTGLGIAAFQVQRQQPALVKFIVNLRLLGIPRRQAEIAVGLLLGRNNSEIAAALRISPNTVAYHLKQLYLKLGVRDRASLVARVRNYSGAPTLEPDAPCTRGACFRTVAAPSARAG